MDRQTKIGLWFCAVIAVVLLLVELLVVRPHKRVEVVSPGKHSGATP